MLFYGEMEDYTRGSVRFLLLFIVLFAGSALRAGETLSEEELYPNQQFLRLLFEPIIGKYPPEESR